MMPKLNLQGCSLTGSACTKPTNPMRRLIRDSSLLLTPEVSQFLSIHAPRAFRVATLLAVDLKATVRLSYVTAILDGLTVLTTFSISTPCRHYDGLILARNTLDSRLFDATICERTQFWSPHLNWYLVDILSDLSSKVTHGSTYSDYHVLTSRKTLHLEALPLPVQ